MRQGLLTRRVLFGSDFNPMALGLSKVTGDGFVKVENSILKCKSNANNESAYAFYPVAIGLEGYIEVLFEAKRVSGSSVDFDQAGGVGYNNYTDAQPVTGIGGNLPDWTKIMSSEWKSYRFVIPADLTKSFVAIMVGCFNNSIGEYWFRRLEVNVYNMNLASPDTRICKIIKDNRGWRVDRDPNTNSNIGCERVDVFSGYVKLTYGSIQAWTAPIVATSIEATAGRNGWSAQPVSITNNSCNIQINSATGSPQTPSAISGNIYINVMIMGA